MVKGFRDNLKTPQMIPYLIPVSLQIVRISRRLLADRPISYLNYLHAIFVRSGFFASIWFDKVNSYLGSLLCPFNLYACGTAPRCRLTFKGFFGIFYLSNLFDSKLLYRRKRLLKHLYFTEHRQNLLRLRKTCISHLSFCGFCQ